MKYSISEMASLLGVTTHSLRYYEKIGIIHPIVNEDTGYRKYSVLDTRRFNLARFYRGFDFGLEEVKDMLSNEDDVIHHFKRKEEEIKKDIILAELKLNAIHRYKYLLNLLNQGIDQAHIIEIDAYIRIEISDDETMRLDEKTIRLRDQLLKYSPLVKWVSRIPNDVLNNTAEHHYHYGLNMKLSDAEKLGINISEYDILPKSNYLITFFKKESKKPYSGKNIEQAVSSLHEFNIHSYQSGYSSCLKSIKEKEEYHNYHYFLIQIK